MGAAKEFAVVAPLVVAHAPNGAQVYLYQGAVLPDYIAKAEIDRLIADDMVAERSEAEERLGAAGAQFAAPSGHLAPNDEGPGDPGDPATVPDPDLPAGNASTEEWVTYAVGKGMPEGDAVELGRDGLRDKYTA